MGLISDSVKWPLRLALIAYFLRSAYTIRLYAIQEYGLVIHEFDPWFNFRATQYLADNGYDAFFKWFDHMSWYPLGRPVGTTIYPGMQITAVLIWQALNAIGGSFAMSLNDVCCYVPAWFGVLATGFLGMLTYECTDFNVDAAIAATGIMAIVPAHIMRSVGGGFDNESVAVTAMCATFYFWVRSLRAEEGAWRWGVVTGLAYINMAAAWGGYIFVLNMIGMHAVMLVAIGRYSEKLRRAYTLFYVIGTAGAMQVPVIGWTPLKSFEQLGPFGVLIGLQVLWLVETQRRKLNIAPWSQQAIELYAKIGGLAAVAVVAVIAAIYPTGYFGPFSSRIRALFVQHTRTGNPLVDSVAEHQPTTPQAYYQYLHASLYLAPVGYALSFVNFNDSKSFLIAYMSVAYFFSAKMMRLVLLMGPITSALAGVAIVAMFGWVVEQVKGGFREFVPEMYKEFEAAMEKKSTDEPKKAATAAAGGAEGQEAAAAAAAAGEGGAGTKKKKKKKSDDDWYDPQVAAANGSKNGGKGGKGGKDGGGDDDLTKLAGQAYNLQPVKLVRYALAAWIAVRSVPTYFGFHAYSHQLAQGMSQPTIMYKGRLQNGETIMVDDYREAYWWLRDNTPEDSRVMAWWDYGYQITGIANRTTIADGNTWNHEHIATLGRCLTGPEREAHRMVRHLADYVLVWGGGGGDDLAKSPHMARIANSVYPDVCPGDPTCSKFGFDQYRRPTPMMEASLLYKLHSGGPGRQVFVDPNRFKNVFNSKYGKVRIWQVLAISEKSRAWSADKANRVCDAPGSWYCEGKYPPLLQKLFKKKGVLKKDFKQLEDFNKKGDDEDDEYQKEYMDRMAGKKTGKQTGATIEKAEKKVAADTARAAAQNKADLKKEEEKRKASKEKAKKKTAADKQAEAAGAAAEAQAEAAAAAAKAKKEAAFHRRRRRDAAAAASKTAKWEDTAETAALKAAIASGKVEALEAMLQESPSLVHVRSADGEGPLFWAWQQGSKPMRTLLVKNGSQKDVVDKAGKSPKQHKKKKK